MQWYSHHRALGISEKSFISNISHIGLGELCVIHLSCTPNIATHIYSSVFETQDDPEKTIWEGGGRVDSPATDFDNDNL